MWQPSRPQVTTAPTEEAVSLEEAKLHLRVDDDSEDPLILSLVTAAREYVEAATSRRLVTTALRIEVPYFCSQMWLPGSPLIAVQSVKYLLDGSLSTLASTNYDVVTNKEPGLVQISDDGTWPTTDISPIAVQINYTAGYGGASSVPQAAKAAIKLLVGHWYSQREAVNVGNIVAEVPFTTQQLINQLQVWQA
jgi:uncharacterized phiE125 gp8 family phage protein